MAAQVTLSTVRQLLRQGKHPEEIGASTYSFGCYRTAYKIGPFIVKDACGGPFKKSDYDRNEMRRERVRFAPTVVVGGYAIQLAYKPLPDEELFYRIYPDIHGGNVGRDRRGRYVAFDW